MATMNAEIHAIVDLETLAVPSELGPGESPEVTEIGLVFFRADSFEVVKMFSFYPEAGNGTITPGTVGWWMKEAVKAEKLPEWCTRRMMGDTKPVDTVLVNMLDVFDKWKPVKVWGNDPEMDLSPLENWFHATGRVCPWFYYQRMDVRSVKDWTGVKPERVATHGAVDDCLREIEILAQARGVNEPRTNAEGRGPIQVEIQQEMDKAISECRKAETGNFPSIGKNDDFR